LVAVPKEVELKSKNRFSLTGLIKDDLAFRVGDLSPVIGLSSCEIELFRLRNTLEREGEAPVLIIADGWRRPLDMDTTVLSLDCRRGGVRGIACVLKPEIKSGEYPSISASERFKVSGKGV
jgi:hypothetical protein